MTAPGVHRDAEGLARTIDTELRVSAEFVRHWDPVRTYLGEPLAEGSPVRIPTGGAAYLGASLREYDKTLDRWTVLIDSVTVPSKNAGDCDHVQWHDLSSIDWACTEEMCAACGTRRWTSRRRQRGYPVGSTQRVEGGPSAYEAGQRIAPRP